MTYTVKGKTIFTARIDIKRRIENYKRIIIQLLTNCISICVTFCNCVESNFLLICYVTLIKSIIIEIANFDPVLINLKTSMYRVYFRC